MMTRRLSLKSVLGPIAPLKCTHQWFWIDFLYGKTHRTGPNRTKRISIVDFLIIITFDSFDQINFIVKIRIYSRHIEVTLCNFLWNVTKTCCQKVLTFYWDSLYTKVLELKFEKTDPFSLVKIKGYDTPNLCDTSKIRLVTKKNKQTNKHLITCFSGHRWFYLSTRKSCNHISCFCKSLGALHGVPVHILYHEWI